MTGAATLAALKSAPKPQPPGRSAWPQLELQPLSVHHRILRQLAAADLAHHNLADAVATDGHAPQRDLRLALAALQHVGLVLRVQGTPFAALVYAITPEGRKRLQALEQQVQAALALLPQRGAMHPARPEQPPAIQALRPEVPPSPVPRAAIERHVGTVRLLSGAGAMRRGSMTAADRLATVPRPGAMDAYALPSRVGDKLHWPGGRVTDMDGQPLAA